MRERLKKQLIRHEGLRFTVYDDDDGMPIKQGTIVKGHPTIGVGRNLEAKPISRDIAMRMLDEDVFDAEADLLRNIPFFKGLDPVRQDVLVNMSFNMGITRLMGFRKMWSALALRNYDEVSKEMLDSKWAKQVKGRATELSEQMRTGEYKDELS